MARAQIDKWAEWYKINLSLAFTVPIFWRVVRTAPSQQDAQSIADAIVRFDQLLGVAEAQLSGNRFLAGPDFSLADIVFGHILFRYYTIEIDRPARQHVEAFYRTLTERPAYREHVMVSFEPLRVSD